MRSSSTDFDFSHLPVADRMLLAHAVIDSAIAEAHAAPVTPDQLDKISRCDAAVDSGEMKCESWEIVRRRLFAAK